MSLKFSITRPKSASLCHQEATALSGFFWRPCFATSLSQTGSMPAICCSNGCAGPGYSAAATPRWPASSGDGFRCRPNEVFGDDASVGDINNRVILLRRTWKDEGSAGFLADCCIGSERRRHVHLVADGVADERMRTVYRPNEAVVFRRGG